MAQGSKKVAFLLAEGFEDSEMKNPYEAIVKNGNDAVIIGLEKGVELTGKRGTVSYTTHMSAEEADPSEFSAVIIPGGKSPSHLRESDAIIRFVQEADGQGVPISAICHGPQVLQRAGLLKNKSFTSYPGIAEEIAVDGAVFLDKPVVVEDNLIMSRTPDDEPYFIEETIKRLGVDAY
ncbi:protease [Cohnella pontilimi]|uniref:Protease n=1 Tax=Cohnella pontilimi TaxID=2564100 RepID=A0A4U0F9H7_9BACL|nr:DJ-1/PfpI family protein [Cohnella pontilimi]TJY41347.1 protease [Cohnella pontilimi]